MTYSTALSLTLPSLTSDHRQQLLEKQPLLSLYELFATIPADFTYLQNWHFALSFTKCFGSETDGNSIVGSRRKVENPSAGGLRPR